MDTFVYDEIKNTFYKNDEECIELPNLVWHITNTCELQCPYCFAPKYKSELDIGKIKLYKEFFQDLKVKKIDISGGNPFNYKHLDILCSALHDKQIWLTITSNGKGSLKNYTWVQKHIDFFSRIIFSINGPDKKMHDKIVHARGAFSDVIGKFLFFKKQNNTHCRINSVMTKQFFNKDTLRNMMELVDRLNPVEWCVIQPYYKTGMVIDDELYLSVKDFKEICDEIEYLKKVVGIKTDIIYRTNENYNSYWVIYPDGKIILFSENENVCYDLENDNKILSKIMQTLESRSLWVP